jgi:hypothetical protein
MADQVRDLGEPPTAALVLAHIGLLLVVHSGVLLQRTILCKPFRAFLAIVNESYHSYGRSPVCNQACSLSVFLQVKVLVHPFSAHEKT